MLAASDWLLTVSRMEPGRLPTNPQQWAQSASCAIVAQSARATVLWPKRFFAHPRRMMAAAVIGTSVVIGSVSPGVASVGDARILGLVASVPSALSRYGGVKICPSRWFTLPMQGHRRQLFRLFHAGLPAAHPRCPGRNLLGVTQH